MKEALERSVEHFREGNRDKDLLSLARLISMCRRGREVGSVAGFHPEHICLQFAIQGGYYLGVSD